MKSLSTQCVALSAATALLVAAQGCQAADMWLDAASVTQLYPNGSGVIFLVDTTNPLSTCNGKQWSIPATSANYKALLGSLMMAYAMGLKVQLHINDQPASCEPVVDRFLVIKPA